MKKILKHLSIGALALVLATGCSAPEKRTVIEDPAFGHVFNDGLYGVYANSSQGITKPVLFLKMADVGFEYHGGKYQYPANRRSLPYLVVEGEKKTLHLRYNQDLVVRDVD